VTANVGTRAQIAGMAVAANGSSAWLTAFGDQVVQVFAAPALSLITDLPVPDFPAGLDIHDAGDRVYVAIQPTGRVQMFQLSTRTAAGDFAAGDMPVDVSVSTAQQRVVVVDAETGREQALSFTPTGQPRGGVRLPPGSTDVFCAGNRAYVSGTGRDHVCSIEVAAASLATRAVWTLGSGLGETFTWVVRPLGPARARVAGPTAPETEAFGDRPGRLALRAVYSLGDHLDPYAFEVRLRPELDVPGTVIRKDQYDLLMNVLNLLHPVGTEVRTRSIREHVPEIRAGLLDAFPAYTYPDFRVRGPAPRRPERRS
jgi:hypothetical protein